MKYVLPLLLLLSPLTVFAATTHNYTCNDFDTYLTGTGSGATSCSANVFTLTNDGQIYDTSATRFQFATGTWYVSANVNVSGPWNIFCTPNGCGSTLVNGTIVAQPITAAGTTGLYLAGDLPYHVGSPPTLQLSNLCITDTAGACEGGPPPSIPPPSIYGSGTTNRLAKFTASTTIGNSLLSDDGTNTTLTSGNLFLQIGALIDTIAAGALSIGTTNATSVTIGGPSVTTSVLGTLSWGKASTATNCNSSASPAACGFASAGSVALPTGTFSLVVNTSAVTANSQILITEDSSLNARLGITCNTNTGRSYVVSARTAGSSFTVQSSAKPVGTKACLSYLIVN